MTQEEKDLLLRDLCARLPYGVKFQLTDDDGIVYNTTLTGIDLDTGIFYGADIDCSFGRCHIENIRPYLRPMSSMTEEEKQVLELCDAFVGPRSIELKVDFYNKQHLDYRGLIEKGLALEVTKENKIEL